jgi:hypothetical protein
LVHSFLTSSIELSGRVNRYYTDLVRAISPVQDTGISIRDAQSKYGVAFNTIRKRVNGQVVTDSKTPGLQSFLGI